MARSGENKSFQDAPQVDQHYFPFEMHHHGKIFLLFVDFKQGLNLTISNQIKGVRPISAEDNIWKQKHETQTFMILKNCSDLKPTQNS